MRQKTCVIQDSYDAVKFLDTIKKSQEYAASKSILVNVFTERTQKDYIAYLKNLIKEHLTKAAVTGITCQAGFALGNRTKNSTIITVLFFFSSDVQVFTYDFTKTSAQEGKEDFLSKISSIQNIRGIQVFTTPMKNTVSNDFLSEISLRYPDIPVFGAGASYETKDPSNDLFAFADQIIPNGLILTVFSGERLKLYAESTLGWTPIGKEMTATEVIDNHILKTIDNETAGSVYKKYLGASSQQFFVDDTCEFPFMIKRGNRWVARIPIYRDDSGYVHFPADIHQGEKLVFSFGSKKFILQQAFNMAEFMSRKNLEGILLHVCLNRFFYLKDEEVLELQAFSNFYRETAGCFAFSEILYRNQSGGLQNSALVAVGFKELEKDEDPNLYSDDCYIEDVRHGSNGFVDFSKLEEDFSINRSCKGPLPFEDRVVYFLHATSRDLHLANQKLEEAATTDGLTKIFNRKKISETIQTHLEGRKEGSALSLIMFDIDNFKRVNDTYGHDRGDEVLVKVSQTAKANIREGDFIGRWGGEEFMILLPETKKADAIEIAERIRKAISSIQWENMNGVTVSLGVAEGTSQDSDESLYKRVDNHLYTAKTSGKNQVVSD